MNSKTLSSWMLIVAPVLFFVVFFVGWEVLIGSSENTSDEVIHKKCIEMDSLEHSGNLNGFYTSPLWFVN